jgi:putative ABC transport system substrate-binding protein
MRSLPSGPLRYIPQRLIFCDLPVIERGHHLVASRAVLSRWMPIWVPTSRLIDRFKGRHFGHGDRFSRRAILLWPLTSVFVPLLAGAQEKKAMRVLGFLHGGPATATSLPRGAAFVDALERGLSETGYVDGENLRIEYRASVQDLIRDQADVIIVANGGFIGQARRATTTIPLVFLRPDDPVSLGLVASFNRPGGNITGVSLLSTELMPKRLQLLRELVPTAKTCAVLINPRGPGVEQSTRAALQGAADRLGFALEIVSARTQSEFEAAFANMAALKAEALLVTTDPLFMGGRGSLVGLAARYAVPTSYPWREFVDVGGLISYGPSLTEAYRQVGIYAGKILDGESPADLPVMQPTIFELVVNLKTAKQLGLSVPQSILGRADEAIE